MKRNFYLIFLSVFYLNSYRAVIVKPVVDFMGNWTKDFNKDSNFYFEQPFSPEKGFSCSRIYQGLFNEVVDVIEEQGSEVKFNYSATFYLKNGVPCSEFYTLSENIKSIEDVNKLPIMPDYASENEFCLKDELVLIDSFVINLNEKDVVFSPGTRFKIDTSYNSSEFYKVYFENNFLFIPCDMVFVNTSELSFEEKKINFVNLLKIWVSNEDFFIPYVFGGSSGIPLGQNCKFNLIEKDDVSFWSYSDVIEKIKIGFDCSALICRAAQIAGIPFYYRNTTTIFNYLDKLVIEDDIKNGDIIFFRGHVIVITDVIENKCIHAQGYNSGYGCVNEVELKNLFKNIETFDDLKNAYINKQGVSILNKNKEVIRFITEFYILKLDSVNKGK